MENRNIIKILLYLLLSSMVLASETSLEQSTNQKRNLKTNESVNPGSGAVITSTVKDASSSDNIKDWTPKNYLERSKENGLSTGTIGNTQSMTLSLPGADASLTKNPNLMTAESIKSDQKLNNEPALTSFDDSLLNTLVSETTSNDVTSELFNDTVKCYITRDIPFRYKCSHTSLIYGDTMNADGTKAKRECESECYEQFEAVEIIKEGGLEDITINDDIELKTKTQAQLNAGLLQTEEFMSIRELVEAEVQTILENNVYNTPEYLALEDEDESGKIALETNYLYTPKEDRIDYLVKTREDEMLKNFLEDEIEVVESIDNPYVLNTISFSYNVLDENKKAYYSISYKRAKDVDTAIEYKAATRVEISGTGSKSITINEVASEVKIVLYANSADVDAILSEVKLKYDGGSYICPLHQDLSNDSAGGFAYICPSGKLKNVTVGYRSYTICEDYGVVGDNLDGTYSNMDRANNICKKNYSCELDTTLMTTDILQEFREGCILGQEDCDENTCKSLRVTERAIVNENVINGVGTITQTIVNKNQVEDVRRPRILLTDELEFHERSAEEMKDAAYSNMISENTFRTTEYSIGEDTEQSNAFAFATSYTGNPLGGAGRSIYWIFKPSSFDVDYEERKFYSVVEVITSENALDENINVIKYKNKIYYVKLPGVNNFKPFARIKRWQRSELGEEGNAMGEELSSSIEYKSFSSSWYSHSPTLQLEYFKKEAIDISEKYSMRIPVVIDSANMFSYFSGIVKRITRNGPYITEHYDGDYDGSAEVISKVIIYTFIKEADEDITYQDVIENINNEEITPIYDNLAYNSFQKEVKDDVGNINDDVQIYMYGKEDKMTGYTRIFPKEHDVGKKGFVFVFAIDENEIGGNNEE